MRANILVDRLPETVMIHGECYEIQTDFRTSILFELLMNDAGYSDNEKIVLALRLYFPEAEFHGIQDIGEAVDAALDFYACENPLKTGMSTGVRGRINYSFEQDAEYIYAAFLSQYGIDLNEIPYLHWWKFSAMFSGLGEEHRISKIMYYRDASTKGMPRKEKAFIEKMKKRYALKNTVPVKHTVSLAKRNAAMKDYVRKRIREAGGNVED